MAAEIGPGTLLECIKGDAIKQFSVQLGSTYTCRYVHTLPALVHGCGFCGHHGEVIALVEVSHPAMHILWCPCIFRPLPPRSKHIDALIKANSSGAYVKKLEPA